jgi:Animal haem peroxidase
MPEHDDATGSVHRADEGVTHHGASQPRGQSAVPRSALFEGRFGRMFRTLPAPRPDREALIALGKAMSEPASGPAARDNPDIPAGYTYFGQFVDHDITFDPVSKLQRFNDPDALTDFRSPRFDLDCLYGSGPADQPFMYQWKSRDFRGVKLLEGRNPDADDNGDPLEREDLLRNRQERAIIGDPRNDENIIVGQLHLAFVRLHNNTVDLVRERTPSLTGAALFDEARRLATWHYQWVVVKDFLVRIAGQDVVDDILKPDGTVELEHYTWVNEPFIPVEFSAAAYRFGHSMIRPAYDLNGGVTQVPLFAASDNPPQLSHLGGFRALPAAWTIEWKRFVKIANTKPQLSRRIDTRLADPLMKLPKGIDGQRNSLATLNLRRGKALQLPSGQSVAGAMSQPVLAAGDLGLDQFDLKAAHQAQLEQDTPLWYYVLREAALGGGNRLGPVGGRIVAEVLIGLLSGDPQSFLRQQPTWKPELLPSKKAGEFTLADLLKFATP